LKLRTALIFAIIIILAACGGTGGSTGLDASNNTDTDSLGESVDTGSASGGDLDEEDSNDTGSASGGDLDEEDSNDTGSASGGDLDEEDSNDKWDSGLWGDATWLPSTAGIIWSETTWSD
jgi:hypothetical protein